MSRLKPEFDAWHQGQSCAECGDLWMSIVGADGCQVYCPHCWTPVPVPTQFLYWSQRLALAKDK